MRFTLGLLLILLSGCVHPIAIKGLGVKLSLDQRTLSNGLTVLMVEDHTVPIITYQTWYRVGSLDEKPGMTGISHLFEHLMFKGTPKYGPKRFFQELEAKGAEVNAFTTRDYTVYYENFVPDLLEKVIDMEADRMSNLKLDPETLNSEKMVVLEERRMRSEDSPEGRLQEALWALAYRRHPYQWPVIGYEQDVIALTPEQIVSYYHSHYQPGNAALVIVGDFKPDVIWPLIRKYYGSIPALPKPRRDLIPVEPEQQEERQLTLRDRVASERFSMAYHVTSAQDDDSFALDVLANILFEGTSSRAHRRLVEESNLALGVSGSNYTPTCPGLFTINVTLRNGVPAAQAQAALDALIRDVQEKGVTDEEIRTAVRQLTVELVDSVRTPQGFGQLLGTVQTILGDPRRFATDLQKYFRVKGDDVKRVASKYLVPNNRSIVFLKGK